MLISGGADSVFLFYQFLELKKSHNTKFSVIHFNHHLRGNESDEDHAFVKSLCKKNNIPFLVIHLKGLGEKSIQEKARFKRQHYLKILSQKYGFNLYVSAHHGDDVIETIVMKSDRGSGYKGLTGIREQTQYADYILLRPLINVFKKDILAHLKENNLTYREDSSNKSKKYFRNRVRLGCLLEIDENKKERLLDFAQRLQQIDEYFESRLKYLIKKYHHFVPSTVWLSWPNELRFRFFRFKMAQNGFLNQIEDKHFKETEQTGDVKLVLKEAVFQKDDSGCYFFAKKEQRECVKKIIEKVGAYYFGKYRMRVSLQCQQSTANSLQQNDDALFLCAHKMKFPLFLEKATLSDFFVPFGHSKTIKLKKIFNQKKISKYQRRIWPVLKNKKGSVIAVPGLEIADDFKVLDTDNECYVLKLGLL